MAETIKQQFDLFLAEKGLTPLTELHRTNELSTEQQDRLKLYEEFQRAILNGFTVKKLQDAGCWEKQDAKKTALGGIPIHPLYQLDRWKRGRTDFMIGNGYEGSWSRQNPLVWKALRPSLKMASLLISKSHLWGW